MKHMSRRSFFSSASTLVIGGVFLGGCVSTRNGDTTTFTVNVDRINSYITAGVNAANTALVLIKTVPTLAAYVAPLTAGLALLSAASDAFHAGVGADLVVEYTNTTIKTRIDSILAAIEQIMKVIGSIVSALVSAGLSFSVDWFDKIQLTYEALKTMVSVFVAILQPQFAHVSELPKSVMRAEEVSLRVLNA